MAPITLKSLSEDRKDMFLIPLENIKEEEGYNVREDFGDLDELASSLAKNGQKEPLTVRMSSEDKTAILVNGHRRIRAFVIANDKYSASFKAAWCIPEEKGANEESRIFDLFTRNSGKPLTPMEQAAAVKKLVDFNWKIKDVAAKIGKPVKYVNNILELCSASKDLRNAVQSGFISTTAAVMLAKAPISKQVSVINKIKELQSDGKDKKDKDKKAHVSVSEVEKEVIGTPTMISSRSIKDIIKQVSDIIKENKEDKEQKGKWEAVKYGLELSLGKKTLDADNFKS
jgi:ParB/RepB/Spo0J family partition protein